MSNPVRRRSGGFIAGSRPRRTSSNRLADQINRNLVALISLMLAIASLGYNTWRNEKTEVQRNYRQAAFQILIEVGELEQIVLLRRYFIDELATGVDEAGSIDQSAVPMHGNWVAGWGKVRMLRDISSILPAPLPEHGRALYRTWEERAGDLDNVNDPDSRQQASAALLESLKALRESTIQIINDLS